MDEYFKEYNACLNRVEIGETRLNTLKNYKERKEAELLTQTDFKKLYNQNNDKIRKYHVNKTLKNTVNDIKNLELSIDADKRRISFLKRVIDFNTKMVDHLTISETNARLDEQNKILMNINETLKYLR